VCGGGEGWKGVLVAGQRSIFVSSVQRGGMWHVATTAQCTHRYMWCPQVCCVIVLVHSRHASQHVMCPPQVQAGVLRRSPEVVVATPGRLIDHLRNTQSVGLEDLAVLVLDEADRCVACVSTL
jgi:hypothetical protein